MKNYFKFYILLISITLGFVFNGCGTPLLTPAYDKAMQNGEGLYLQQNMRYLITARGIRVSDTINGAKGFLIPVNSIITIKDVDNNKLIFINNGAEIVLKNTIKQTGMSISQVALQYFGKTKVDLSRFNTSELAAITSAQITKGISKEAVLITRGYPSAKETTTIQSNRWVYYESRGLKAIVEFEDNIVK